MKGLIIFGGNNEPSLKPPFVRRAEWKNQIYLLARSFGVASLVKFPPPPSVHSVVTRVHSGAAVGTEESDSVGRRRVLLAAGPPSGALEGVCRS